MLCCVLFAFLTTVRKEVKDYLGILITPCVGITVSEKTLKANRICPYLCKLFLIIFNSKLFYSFLIGLIVFYLLVYGAFLHQHAIFCTQLNWN